MGITFVMICVFVVAVLAIAPAIATVVILVRRKPDHPSKPMDSDESKKTFAFPVIVSEPTAHTGPPSAE
jgi:hypothetical protein